MASEGKLKLFYFNIPGKGEPIRLALTYAGIPFEDVRLDGEKFRELKESGRLAFGQVPALELPDGRQIVQSNAILRYIGRIAKEDLLYPKDPYAAAMVDSILDAENDMMTGVHVYRYKGRFGWGHVAEDPSSLEKAKASLTEEVLPRHLAAFERLAELSKSGWIAGTAGPSIADFVLQPRLSWLDEGVALDGPSGFLSKCPRLAEMCKSLLELPAIKAYYAKQ